MNQINKSQQSIISEKFNVMSYLRHSILSGVVLSSVIFTALSTNAYAAGENNSSVLSLQNQIIEQDSRFNRASRESRAGMAGSVAIASLSQAFRESESLISVGGGAYRDQSAVAVGLSRVSDNGRWVMKMTGSADTSGHYMGGASVGFRF